MSLERKIATFIETGLAAADERDEIIDNMSREQMVAYSERQMAIVRGNAQRLARDLSAANGTTFKHELRLLQRDLDEAIAATPTTETTEAT